MLTWFTMLALGVKHCHDRRIIHRDLKAQNIFMCRNGMAKIGDFGVSRVLARTHDMVKSVNGTPYYMAPELFDEVPYSFPADVWSLGILLYEMCTLTYPFKPEDGSYTSLGRLVKRTKYDPLPSQYSDTLNILLTNMLEKDPKRRPNINQIFKFPLIADYIPKVVSMKVFKDEFTHTILHNRDVFADLKTAKK